MPPVEPSRRLIVWLGLVLLLAYSAWIGGPYLRSIVVRDAALTTWVHVAAAPIEGRVTDVPVRPGERLGADGHILSIDNLGADRATLNQARTNLDRARARLAAAGRRDEQARRDAQDDLDEAFRLFDARRGAVVAGPPGAMLLGLTSGAGAMVEPGTSVATFADCRVMLIDAPVPQWEIPLLYLGSEAIVVVEGERQERTGRIMLTRGSRNVLGPTILAATPLGRRAGFAQVLVALDVPLDDPSACPIGQPAFVRFPDVSGYAILRSHLPW